MDDMLTKVINFAFDYHISIETHNDWPTDWPPVSIPEQHRIMLNTRWQQPDEMVFAAAHEIGHVLNGDVGTLYYDNSRVKSDTERDADRTAIRVLYDICKEDEDFDPAFFNPLEFMVNFKIPACYQDYVFNLR